jgi:hypothetical protein
MIDASQLRNYVIAPALEHLGMGGLAAENLLLGTAAAESEMGTWLVQLSGGPARGVFQMEPRTLHDLRVNWLDFHPDLSRLVDLLLYPHDSPEVQLVTNLAFATAVARCEYRRHPPPIPDANDLLGLGRYYVKWWCRGGKGTVEKFVSAYQRCVGAA